MKIYPASCADNKFVYRGRSKKEIALSPKNPIL